MVVFFGMNQEIKTMPSSRESMAAHGELSKTTVGFLTSL
jgi:hypothetical protein